MEQSRSRLETRENGSQHRRSRSAHASTQHRETAPVGVGIYAEEVAKYNAEMARHGGRLRHLPSPDPSDFETVSQLLISQPAMAQREKERKWAEQQIREGKHWAVPWARDIGPPRPPLLSQPTSTQPVRPSQHVPSMQQPNAFPVISSPTPRRPSHTTRIPTSSPVPRARTEGHNPHSHGTAPTNRPIIPYVPPGPKDDNGHSSDSDDSFWNIPFLPARTLKKKRRKRVQSLPSSAPAPQNKTTSPPQRSKSGVNSGADPPVGSFQNSIPPVPAIPPRMTHRPTRSMTAPPPPTADPRYLYQFTANSAFVDYNGYPRGPWTVPVYPSQLSRSWRPAAPAPVPAPVPAPAAWNGYVHQNGHRTF